MHRQGLLLLLCLGAPLWGAQAEGELPVHSNKWSDKYDSHFRKYTKRYFGPYYDWHWFKSQAIVESNLKPGAKSHRGAVGLMQILPTTFAEIKTLNPHFINLEEPRWNIAAGIYYDRTIYRKWDLPSDQDRLYLAFASYNAGYVRMRRAYKRTPQPVESWEQVKPMAPQETRDYVQRIRTLMDSDTPKPRSRLRGIAKLLHKREEAS
ncbi:MAG: transglycosylase SLT domain-containing protein [Pseudomonadota bacterium]